MGQNDAAGWPVLTSPDEKGLGRQPRQTAPSMPSAESGTARLQSGLPWGIEDTELDGVLEVVECNEPW